jgi:hypothetical protein
MRMLLVMLILMVVAVPADADITGKARVIDGDTIEVGSERVRLHGIDAPESKQTYTAGEQEWACRREATGALTFEVGHHWVEALDHPRHRSPTLEDGQRHRCATSKNTPVVLIARPIHHHQAAVGHVTFEVAHPSPAMLRHRHQRRTAAGH